MMYDLSILKVPSGKMWLNAVLEDFNSFLQDHADCERKASAMAMSFIAKYPDKLEIIPQLIETAIEELQHFKQVYKLMQKRGIALPAEMTKDHYVKALLQECKPKPMERFMDRLILASIIEWRGCERFKMIADHIENNALKSFYKALWESEARHGESFVQMALLYFPQEEVEKRMENLLVKEAAILQELPLRAALH